jgi:hypothetical protein
MILFFASFLGRLAKALIFKASRHLSADCPQSYPQKTWMTCKTATNQALRAFFGISLEPTSPT